MASKRAFVGLWSLSVHGPVKYSGQGKPHFQLGATSSELVSFASGTPAVGKIWEDLAPLDHAPISIEDTLVTSDCQKEQSYPHSSSCSSSSGVRRLDLWKRYASGESSPRGPTPSTSQPGLGLGCRSGVVAATSRAAAPCAILGLLSGRKQQQQQQHRRTQAYSLDSRRGYSAESGPAAGQQGHMGSIKVAATVEETLEVGISRQTQTREELEMDHPSAGSPAVGPSGEPIPGEGVPVQERCDNASYSDRPTIEKLEGELRQCEEEKGPDHPAVAEACLGLAIAHIKHGRMREAEPLCERMCAIFGQVAALEELDEDGSLIAVAGECLLNLGIASTQDKVGGGCERALKWAQKAQALLTSCPGSTQGRAFLLAMSDTVSGMAYLGMRDFAGGVRAAEKARERLTGALGRDHTYVAQAHFNVGDAYMQQGRTEDAELALREALRVFRLNLGEDHPSSLQTYAKLSTLGGDAGREEKAMQAALTRALGNRKGKGEGEGKGEGRR